MKKKDNLEVEILEVKKKPHKWRSRFAKVGICLLAMIGGLATTYFLVPNRTQTIDLGMPDQPTPAEETYFSRFVSRLTLAADDSTGEEFPALSADFEDFSIEWPDNTVAIDGNLKFSMKGLSNLNLTLDVEADYNGKTVDLGVGLVEHTLYLAVKDLRLKQSFVETEDVDDTDIGTILDEIIYDFFTPENEEGLQINLDIENILGSLIGGVDLGSLFGGVGLSVNEVVGDDDVTVELGINISEDSDPINLKLILGKENLGLKRVDLGTIKVGDVEIKGALACDTSSNIRILGLDHPEYPKQRGEFTEIISYSSWIGKVFNLLKTRQIGLNLAADVKLEDASLGYLNLAADLDASELFDLQGFDLQGLLFDNKEEPVEEKSIKREVEVIEENEIVSLLNNFDFNVGLELGNYVKNSSGELEKIKYSDLDLAYYTDKVGHNAGYLSLNDSGDEAVMRAKIDVETINFLIAKISSLIKDEVEPAVKAIKRGEVEEEESFFDFVTNSDLVSEIKAGHYEGILDVLETLKNTGNTIEIVLNLSSLGFGENAKVSLVLDATDEADVTTNVISIGVENLELNTIKISGEIYTRPYDKTPLEIVDQNKDKYDNLNFVHGIFGQVEQIMDTKQAAFTLEGDVLDADNLGFDFSGWAQLDYGMMDGMGSIKFNQYKSNPEVLSNDHQVDISINNFTRDHAENNMLFEYSNPNKGNNSPLRGKFTLQTFDDIIDLVMKLIDEKDVRFMKFLEEILEELRASLIMQIISTKDYVQLSKSSLVKKIAQTNDGLALDIVIGKELIPLNLVKEDLHLQLEFNKDELGERTLKAINIVDLDLGEKKVNVTIALTDYVAEKENPVDVTKDFLDFSDIAVLLEFGINTMSLNYYHLTGTIALRALLIINIKVELDFYIVVDGTETKIYGRIPTIPGIAEKSAEFVFEPDSVAAGNNIGGYFYIVRNEDHLGSLLDGQWYYKCDSKNFLDNILTYLLADLLDLPISDLGDLSIGSATEKNPAYENMFTGDKFVYNESKHEWKLGLDLGVLTGNTAFSTISGTIGGTLVDGDGFWNKIHAETSIISILSVKADIDLEDPDPTINDWSSTIQARYEKIVGYYDKLSSYNQGKAFNNPGNGLKLSLGTI